MALIVGQLAGLDELGRSQNRCDRVTEVIAVERDHVIVRGERSGQLKDLELSGCRSVSAHGRLAVMRDDSLTISDGAENAVGTPSS
jgi:hypothetical protein